MDSKKAGLCGLALVGGAIFLVLYRTGRTPSVTVDPLSVANTWSPYSWWCHSSPVAYRHHFPDTVAPNCLPLVYQNEDIGEALNHVEVDGASCAQ